MDCKKFSQILELSALGRTGDADSVELSDHLERCIACKKKYINIREHDLKIKQRLEDVDVPEDLEDRIIANYRYSQNEDRDRKIIRLRYLPLTAAVALVFILAYFFLDNHILRKVEFSKIISSSLTNHNQNLASQFNSDFSPMKVKTWFAGKPDSEVRVPEFGDNLDYLGGRNSKLCCTDAAYLLYRKGNKRVSLFIFNPAEFEIKIKRETLKREGKTIVLWKEDGLGYCMVMDPGIRAAAAIVKCCEPSGSNCSVPQNNCK